MSDPKPQYILTEDEWSTLAELFNRQDRQGIEDFFKAMPQEKATAIVTYLMGGQATVIVACAVRSRSGFSSPP